MEGTDGFAPGIPACDEGGQHCVVTCGFVGCLLVTDLLVPALGICGAADTDRCSPDGGLSMGVHRDLLLECCRLLWCAVRSTNRLIENVGRGHQTVQRIVVTNIMNTIHVLNVLEVGAIACGNIRGKAEGRQILGRNLTKRHAAWAEIGQLYSCSLALYCLNGEGVFEFFHTGFEILDFALLLF